MIYRWTFMLYICVGSLSVQANLKWKDKTVRMEVHPLQLKATALYPFENTGKEPVEIIKITPSCGCLASRMEKKHFAPGETGVLSVEFNLENRVGSQHKSIKVVSSAKPDTADTLYVDVDIPEAFKLSSKRVMWNKEEERAPKICRFSNTSNIPLYLTAIKSAPAGMRLTIRPIRPGFEYDLVIDPDKDLENARAVIRIGTICPSGLKQSKIYKVFVIVK